MSDNNIVQLNPKADWRKEFTRCVASRDDQYRKKSINIYAALRDGVPFFMLDVDGILSGPYDRGQLGVLKDCLQQDLDPKHTK